MENHQFRYFHSRTVEQGQLVGQKAPFKLKEIWAIGSIANSKPMSRIGVIQLGGRQ